MRDRLKAEIRPRSEDHYPENLDRRRAPVFERRVDTAKSAAVDCHGDKTQRDPDKHNECHDDLEPLDRLFADGADKSHYRQQREGQKHLAEINGVPREVI